jgi:hypothetical protein
MNAGNASLVDICDLFTEAAFLPCAFKVKMPTNLPASHD